MKPHILSFVIKKISNLNIKIQETLLIRQYETKFLGVILTDKLKWNKHIDVVSSKASKCVGIISKVRHLIPLHLTRLLYSTLVEPYITYCNLVWCLPVKTVMLDKILKIQKKYCRLMTFSSFTARSKPLFLQLKILPVYDIYKLQLATYMYKILNNLIPTFDHHSFITGSSIHDHDTGYKNYLRKPICRTTLQIVE